MRPGTWPSRGASLAAARRRGYPWPVPPRYRQNPRTAGRRFESGQAAVLLVDDGRLVMLNATGGAVWQLCEVPLTLEEIATRLAADYLVEPERAARDAEAFCRDLVGRGVLEVA